MRLCIVLGIVASSLWLGNNNVLYAAVDNGRDDVWIRIGGTDIYAEFSTAPGEVMAYVRGEDCGAGHKTTLNNFFFHFHVSWVWGDKLCDDGVVRPVTKDTVEAYWDHYYGGSYDSVPLGENQKQNCWGFAFGHQAFVDGLGAPRLWADDTVAATSWAETKVLKVDDSHAIRVTQVLGNPYVGETVKTSEKNQQSTQYKASWSFSNPPGERRKWRE